MVKKLFLCLACVGLILASTPKPAQADPLFWFLFTAMTGGWAAVTYEECKAEGVDLKDCAKKTWDEREGVPITQAVYDQRFNQ